MTVGDDWNAEVVVAACTVAPWTGRAWRIHDRKYAPTDTSGSLRVSGRFNRGLDQYPPELTWTVLYLALGSDVALAELIRHLRPELLTRLKHKRLTELQLELSVVADCRNLDWAALGVAEGAFFHDTDYRVPQEVGRAALVAGFEAILVPSATLLGDNLILFEHNLRDASRVTVVDSVDPRLFVGDA